MACAARSSGCASSSVRGSRNVALSEELLKILVCPVCKRTLDLAPQKDALVCKHCRLSYPVEDDIPVLIVSAAKKLD